MIDSAIATLTSPLEDARSQLAEAAGHLGLSSGLHQLLADPRRELTVRVPLRLDNGEMQLFVGLTLLAAATTMAVSRVAEAHTLRGLYP